MGVFIGVLPLLLYNYVIFGNFLDFTYYHMDPVIWPHLVGKSGFDFPPNLLIVARLLIDPYRGLFFYSPILIFSLVGLLYMVKRYKLEALLVSFIFSYLLLVNACWWAWDGGTSFGPRHLLPTIPFLIIPLLFSIKNIPLSILKPLIIVFPLFLILLVLVLGNG
jgi:hypothetical protein